MKDKIKKQIEGITLIALVITIIVLLILSAIAINLSIGNNGMISKTKNTTEAYIEADQKEENEIKKLADKINEILGNEDDSGDDSNIDGEYIFDSFKNGNIKVGDYINYDAGVWTNEDINLLKDYYAGEKVVTKDNPYDYGFSGFKVGDSRNESHATEEGKNPNSGWRILEINESTNTIKIIHAGISEAFYQISDPLEGSTSLFRGGFKGEYILSGIINNSGKDEWDYSAIEKRDWSMYVNEKYAIQARACRASEILNITGSYGETNNNLRAIGNIYWCANACMSYGLYNVYPEGDLKSNYASHSHSWGIRPIVWLKNVKIYADEGEETHTTPETAWNFV